MGALKPSIMVGVLVSAIALSACQRSVSALDTRLPPEPLPSTPLEPVQTGELGPPGLDGQPSNLTPGANQQNDQLASLDPNAQPGEFQPDQSQGDVQIQGGAAGDPAALGGEPISRESMAGTWTVATDNPDCRIILAFTKWSGGYRAATRRCNSGELSSISAWDVNGGTVVLVDGNGNRIASLQSAGAERYAGATASGAQVTFSR
jgi:hypothetical protein